MPKHHLSCKVSYRNMVPKTIAVIGSLNTDLVTVTRRIPSGGETLTASSFSTGSGGKGANQAVACARLSRTRPSTTSRDSSSDVTVKMIGAVGADEFGPRMIAGLQSSGIDTSGVRQVEGMTTGVAVILVEEGSGENRILLNPGANHTLRADEFAGEESLVFGGEKPDLIVMQLEVPMSTVLQVLEAARKADVSVLLNPAPAVKLPVEAYKGITHLIVNESEAAILSGREIDEIEKAGEGFDWGEVTDQFLEMGVQFVVVTLGAKGAWFASGKGKGRLVRAEEGVKVVDTTAAGDTFVGAYAVDVVRSAGENKWDMKRAVEWACKAGARTVERKGAQEAIPWADEVERQP